MARPSNNRIDWEIKICFFLGNVVCRSSSDSSNDDGGCVVDGWRRWLQLHFMDYCAKQEIAVLEVSVQ